ncbi:jg12154 [Pararge aegeria aegeria]|uniref:Jg12154 protein n=1 Tax=Pararge aegeria aegeria TaxID=348720 RepID=A0A8S4RYY3_9NEOP|nr:jg12154 [Pararge aegeria aegeria]
MNTSIKIFANRDILDADETRQTQDKRNAFQGLTTRQTEINKVFLGHGRPIPHELLQSPFLAHAGSDDADEDEPNKDTGLNG